MAKLSDDDSSTPAESKARRSDPARLSPALVATLVAAPVAVIALFITIAAIKFSDKPEAGPIPVDSYQAAVPAETGACGDFVAKLPDTLGDFNDKEVVGNDVRWSKNDSDELVLRCGVSRPAGLAPTSSLQVIDAVQWFMTDTIENRGQAYVSVDHRPYVAMWLPSGSGNAPITDVSTLIASTLEAGPLDFGK